MRGACGEKNSWSQWSHKGIKLLTVPAPPGRLCAIVDSLVTEAFAPLTTPCHLLITLIGGLVDVSCLSFEITSSMLTITYNSRLNTAEILGW